ncbi:MAG: protein kinase [Planctomycetota bacterium]
MSLPKRLPGPGEWIGGLCLEQELGRGGAGAVFRAIAPSGERFAVKLVLRDLEEETPRQRFLREAAVGRELQHENVVRYFGSGVQDGIGFIVMELLEGARPLDEYAAAHGLGPDERVRLFLRVADAVQAAHDAGLVHRDLKPDNVLVTGAGVVKVVDFGLARHMDRERLTQSGATMGTLHFMAPEQVRGDTAHATPRTDVYALGALLYHLLVGRPPVDGDSAIAIMSQILEAEPPPLPPEMRHYEAAMRMAMAKEPAERYPTAASLARDLVASASGSGSTAAAMVQRRSRRRWLGVGTLGAAGLTVLAALAWLSRGPSEADVQAELKAVAGALDELARAGGPLAADAEAIAALDSRVARLGPRAAGSEAAADLRDLQALLALARGGAAAGGLVEGAPAAEARDERPLATARRGAELALWGDAARAVDALSRAVRRGVRRADLLRWRALARGRAEPLEASAARDLLADLDAWRAAGGAADPALGLLRARAQLALGELDAAAAALAGRKDAPPELLWGLALERARLAVSEDPVAAEAALRSLPAGAPPEARHGQARALAAAAERACDAALARSPGGPAAPAAERLTAWMRIVARLRPASPPLGDALRERMLSEISGIRREVTIELATALSDAAADDLRVQREVSVLARRFGRQYAREMVPLIRRTIRLETSAAQRLTHRVTLAYVMSAVGDLTPAEERELRAVFADVLPRIEEQAEKVALLTARARFELPRGHLDDAQRDLLEALELDAGFDLANYTLVQLRERQGRDRELVRAAAAFLDLGATNQGRREEVVGILWRHREGDPDRAREALAHYAPFGENVGGWFLRLALLQVQHGELEAARASCKTGAEELQRDDRAEVKAIAKRALEGADDLGPLLEDLVGRLDAIRKDAHRP